MGWGRRSLTLLAAGALVAPLLATPFATPATASPVPPAEIELPVMVEIDPSDYVDAANELPPELVEALQRDTGQSPEEYLAQADAAAFAVDIVDALETQIDVVASELDGTELVVYVGTPADARIAEQTGARVEVGAPKILDLSGISFSPARDLSGGEPYFFPSSDSGEYDSLCSIGFPSRNRAGDYVALTAGHCEGAMPKSARQVGTALAPSDISGPYTPLGPAVGHRAADGFDFGLIPVSSPSAWTFRPQIATWEGGRGAPFGSAPLVIRDATRPVVGATLCKSGTRTGWTCGPIRSVNQTILVGDEVTGYYVNGTVARMCVRPGDSGGAGVVGSTAVGVVSATSQTSGSCPINGSTSLEQLGVFAPLYTDGVATDNRYKDDGGNIIDPPDFPNAAASTLYPDNWYPMIAVSAPAVSAPSSSGGTYTGTTVSGKLPNGRSRHSIRIVFNGTIAKSAAVANDGTWSVDITDLPAGPISYRVVGRWGPTNTSSATTGDFLRVNFVRRAGSDRFATAVAISKDAFPDRAPVVYVANGLTFPDALAAGPVAVKRGGPLLLVGPTEIPDSVRAELTRLKPERIVIVGGTGVVSGAVATQLRSFAPTVQRIGGADRYATSRAVVRSTFSSASEVYVATGANFPDALSAAAAAASRGAPVVLLNGAASGIDSETRQLLRDLKPGRITIAGGTGVVSSGVAAALKQIAPVRRLSGPDRFSTSEAINRGSFSSATNAFIAYGFNFPDALAGSVLAGLRGGPMYISDTKCVPAGMVTHMQELGVQRVTLFGGKAVLTDAVGRLTRC